MASYGWYVTEQGWDLMEKLVAGTATSFEISRVAIGCGDIGDDEPAAQTALISELCEATSTAPVVEDGKIKLTIEYRNDLNGGQQKNYVGTTAIRELGIWANDPDEGEILMYYGALGNYYEAVPAYGTYTVTRRWQIYMAFETTADISITYSPEAMMTGNDVYEYITLNIMPVITTSVEELIEEHNTSETAHQNLRADLKEALARISILELMLGTSVSGTSFYTTFKTLDDADVEGVWNEESAQVEF